jgi:hypothetical protein
MNDWNERNADQKRVEADARKIVDRLRARALYGDANVIEALIYHAADQLARAEALAGDGEVATPVEPLALEVANGEAPKAPGRTRGRPRKERPLPADAPSSNGGSIAMSTAPSGIVPPAEPAISNGLAAAEVPAAAAAVTAPVTAA